MIIADDWSKQFDAMNDFRRIMKHHSHSLPALNYGIQTVTQEVSLVLLLQIQINLCLGAEAR